MSIPKWIPILFIMAALYDAVIGIGFLLMPESLFLLFEVTPPNHFGYVQFPAALLLIFAIMFLKIARNPVANRGLIPYGILLKLAYCSVSGCHWVTGGIPVMWKPFTLIDLVMGVLFMWAYMVISRSPASQSA